MPIHPLKNLLDRDYRHLHALGLVYNDVNPQNFMLDSNGRAVLIDFNSCRPVGARLDGVGRTYKWHNDAVQIETPLQHRQRTCY